jgi:hypothetical protein
MVKFKRFFLKIWLKIPFGYICIIKLPGGVSYSLTKDYHVIYSDDFAEGAIPLLLCPKRIIQVFENRMKELGYND